MSYAEKVSLKKFEIPNSNTKNLLKKLRKKITFDFFSPNNKPFHHHHSPCWIVFIANFFYHCISYIIPYIIMLLKFI